MSLLLQLGCLEQGQPLALGTFSATDRAICLDLAHLGLLLPFWWAALRCAELARGAVQAACAGARTRRASCPAMARAACTALGSLLADHGGRHGTACRVALLGRSAMPCCRRWQACRQCAPDLEQPGCACRHRGGLYAGATRLALALGAGASEQAQHSVGQRFIIVETNYRVRPSKPLQSLGLC